MNLSNKKRGQTRLHHRRRLQLWWIFNCTAAPCLCAVLRIMTECSFVTVSWSRVSSRIFHIIVARIWIILYQYSQSDLLISSRLVRGQTVQWAAHYFLFAPGVPFAPNDEVYFTVMTVSLCTVAINASGSSQTADLCDHIQTRPRLEIWNDATRTCFRRPGCVWSDSSLPPLPSIFSSSSSFLPASSVRSNIFPSAAAAAHFCLDCWKDVSRCHIFLLITSKEKVKVWQDDEDQDLNTDGATAVCYSLMTWREISYLDVTPVVCTQI